MTIFNIQLYIENDIYDMAWRNAMKPGDRGFYTTQFEIRYFKLLDPFERGWMREWDENFCLLETHPPQRESSSPIFQLLDRKILSGKLSDDQFQICEEMGWPQSHWELLRLLMDDEKWFIDLENLEEIDPAKASLEGKKWKAPIYYRDFSIQA